MKLWRIKWETIMVLVMFVATIMGWLFYMQFVEDTRALAIAIVPTIMLLMLLISYNSIKAFRHEVINNWN